jgi:hypothetical protein
MRIKGHELAEWMNTGWPSDDWYWEHDLFDEEPDPDATYDTAEIDGLLYQGRDPDVKDLPSIDTLIRRWRKSRDFVAIAVDCPKGAEAEIRAYLKSKGCKIASKEKTDADA